MSNFQKWEILLGLSWTPLVLILCFTLRVCHFLFVSVQGHSKDPSHMTIFIVFISPIRSTIAARHLDSQDTCCSWHFITVNHRDSIVNCDATTGHGLIASLSYCQGAQHWAQAQRPKQTNPYVPFLLHGAMSDSNSVWVWAQSQERKQFEQGKLSIKIYQL